MDFVGRVYKNKWDGFDITLNSDDLDLLHDKLDAENKVRVRLAFGKQSGKPYMSINDWKPEKKADDAPQQAPAPEKAETPAATVNEDNLTSSEIGDIK